MGLDMYLYARKYESCSRWGKNNYEQRKVDFYPQELDIFDIDNRNFMSKTTEYQIGYWRKANAIHKWFVDNCADGEDNCKPIYVSIEKIKELRNLVNRVIECHEKAEELLPTEEGFFFGSQDYDEWYYQDLAYTKDLLDKVITFIDSHNDYDIIYEASW